MSICGSYGEKRDVAGLNKQTDYPPISKTSRNIRIQSSPNKKPLNKHSCIWSQGFDCKVITGFDWTVRCGVPWRSNLSDYRQLDQKSLRSWIFSITVLEDGNLNWILCQTDYVELIWKWNDGYLEKSLCWKFIIYRLVKSCIFDLWTLLLVIYIYRELGSCQLRNANNLNYRNFCSAHRYLIPR